jgi:predicted AlkP superfamily phosphohydrolase/phosphomutase
VTRILVIGIDGATFDVIRPWSEAGYLPNLARLMREGAHGPLESTIPPVTSPAWPTFATGKNPGKHGVFDFIRPIGGTFELVNASSVHAPTLWQILSRNERTVGVMNVPVTYPPSPINGFVVGGMLSPVGGDFTYPGDVLDPYESRIGPYRIAPRVQYKPGLEAEFGADLLDMVDQRGRYAVELLSDHPNDFLMFHFQGTDVAQHALWKFVDPEHPSYDARAAREFGPILQQIYQKIDGYIGTLVDRLPGDATVIVMSDHGFGPLHYVVNLNLLLIDCGLLRLKPDAWTRFKARLFRAGVTPASIWHLIERAGLQNYVWQVSKSTRNKVVSRFLSFDDVDWARTRAFSIGHVGQIYVNRRDSQPDGIVQRGAEYEAVIDEIVGALRQLRHPETGRPLVDRIVRGDEIASGPFSSQGPDLHVLMDGYRTIAFPLFAADSHTITRQIRGDSGCHRQHGILVAWGAGIRSDATVDGAHIMDLAPTILHLMDMPVPDDMDGKVLVSALSQPGPIRYASAGGGVGDEVQLSDEETAEVETRLRALGYLG